MAIFWFDPRYDVTTGFTLIFKKIHKNIGKNPFHKHLKSVSLSYHRSPKSLKIQLIDAKKKLDDAYLNAEVDFINGKINRQTDKHISKKHHLAWKTIKEISGKNSGGSSKKRLESWLSHFQKLLGKNAKVPDSNTLPSVPVSDTLDINTSPFTTSELKAATKQLKGSKAFGPDNIPAIIWKEEKFHTLLLNLCNHTLSTSVAPRIWHQAQIIPLPKKGDL